MTTTAKIAASSLDELLGVIRNSDVSDEQMVDLPTFGGDEPPSTHGVWSWDETRLIVGTCADDFKIIDRADYKA